MHISIWAAGLWLGLDSFLVSVPLGSTQAKGTAWWRLALAFAVCDGLGSLLGAMLPLNGVRMFVGSAEWVLPAILAGYGIYAIFLAMRAADVTGRFRLAQFAIPVLLSLDNLAHATLFSNGTQALLGAIVAGAVSGGLCVAGLAMGRAASQHASIRRRFVPAGLFLVVAVLLCVL